MESLKINQNIALSKKINENAGNSDSEESCNFEEDEGDKQIE
jgi:hypothetical protein